MCGIYGLLSARADTAPPGDELFQQIDRLVEETEPTALGLILEKHSGESSILETLDATQESLSRWTARGSLLELLASPARGDRLQVAAQTVTRWTRSLEELCERGWAAHQAHREIVNRLIVGGKDIAWRIEKDILENLAAIRDLVQTDERLPLARAYEVNLVLRSLDRLEVRGRDSAGLAIYMRFENAAALDAFLDRTSGGSSWRRELEERRDPRLTHRAVLRPSGAPNVLLLAYKVASEVGKMGDNVAYLRREIIGDSFLQALLREPGLDMQCLAHTRWASNGVISLSNCHPVDSSVLEHGQAVPYSDGRLVAVLNGDIDNYQDLVQRYVKTCDVEIDPSITTDAKIIPVVVAHHYSRLGDLEEAFRLACAEFEGSMAIGLMAADRPGEFFFAQKGSGQGLFFGLGGESVAIASEMYGLVELTPRYVKAEGERSEPGEIFRVKTEGGRIRVDVLGEGGYQPVAPSRVQAAEITTRDINRGSHPHFFLKEISESVQSVRNTLRGKIEVSEKGGVRFLLGPDVLPVELIAGLREGRVRQVVVVGQGTAAVAAQGVAHLLDRALVGAPHPLQISADKAAEFSAYRLKADMSDTLVIAVSQSGTTTDTNRTVDLARGRGAWILAIVNRRNSDLVYKSHGVLYTSDGRDIEMSVASTKAFYSQNVAGQVLALGLASILGTMTDSALREAVEDLRGLAGLLEKTLESGPAITELARSLALGRRYWAVVGGGSGKIAADEIRIKLSELCYKSIAVDYLEDKKHIDLSSEPLVVVCAMGQPEELISDTVKEVAIFKAHRALPIVIAEEGEIRFDPYAAGVIRLPPCRGALSYLPVTMAGHLFGYHAADSMDAVADRLRVLRGEYVRQQESFGYGDDAIPEILGGLSESMAPQVSELEEVLSRGDLDGTLPAGSAVRLSRVLQLILGRWPLDGFSRQLRGDGSVSDVLLTCFSEAISELSRPIDAIKHQAKTVTVGISRGEAAEGLVWRVFTQLGIGREQVYDSHRIFLSALEPLVSAVDGVTLYRVSRLDALGRPTDSTRICVERKLGVAERMESRCDSDKPLTGNKWAVVKHGDVYLGLGQSDGRKVMILPVANGSPQECHVVLFHLQLESAADRPTRLKALRARGKFFDRLRAAVTERNLEWDDRLIDALDNETLFLQPPERLAEELAEMRV